MRSRSKVKTAPLEDAKFFRDDNRLCYALGWNMKTTKLGIIGIFSFIAVLVACSKPPKISKGGGGGADAQIAGDAASGNLPANALQLFQENVYDGVISQECNKCHHNTANQHSTVDFSFAYFTEGGRANYQDSSKSSVVTKVEGGHNCWSGDCTADAQTILDAIDAWYAAMEAEGWVPPPLTFSGGESSEVAFSSRVDHVLNVDPNQYVGQMVADATLGGGWATLQTEEEPDGAIEQHVGDPNGQNGTAAFNFDIAAAGEYFVYVRVKIPEALNNNNQNHLTVTDGTTQFQFDNDTEETGQAWAWRQLLIDDPNDNDLRIPGVYTLPAGPVTLTFAQANNADLKLGYALLTTREDPNLEIFNEKFYDVEMDLPADIGVNGKIIATIWEKAQGEEQEKYIGVKELRVEADAPVYIKGISPVINGFSPNDQATYSIVDGTFGGPTRAEQIIQTGGSTSTTWRGDVSVDKIKLGFEEIRAAQ